MTVGIMQPYFFPYIGYWQLIAAVDRYVVYDDVAYIKGGWINRNNILINGAASLITLPLEKVSSYKNINEINITTDKVQIKKCLKSLMLAYSKAPYFSDVMPIIESVFASTDNIAKFNYNAIEKIKEYLGLQTEIILSSNLEKNNELKAQDKVIHINKLLKSDMYINAIGGMDLYSRDDFRKHDIGLKFLKTGDIMYKQFKDGFVPNLSIIDVLMFNGKSRVLELLQQYVLI